LFFLKEELLYQTRAVLETTTIKAYNIQRKPEKDFYIEEVRERILENGVYK
jgi:hypothetical protein